MRENLRPKPPSRIWLTSVFGRQYIQWESGPRRPAEPEEYTIEIVSQTVSPKQRSLFQRIIRLPILALKHYRVARPFCSPVSSLVVAIRLAIVILK